MGVGGRESASVVLRLMVGLVRVDEVCEAGLHDPTGKCGWEDRSIDPLGQGHGWEEGGARCFCGV